jgi:hypothetical protein
LIATDLLFLVMSLTHNQTRQRILSSHPSIQTRYINSRIGKIVQNNDEEMINALNQSGRYSLIPWFAKLGFSSKVMEFFAKDSFNELDIAEFIELNNIIETLYPNLESYQKLREQRLSPNSA